MFIHIKDIDKLPKFQKNKNINHIIIMDLKGKLAKNPPFPEDHEIIKLNRQTRTIRKVIKINGYRRICKQR